MIALLTLVALKLRASVAVIVPFISLTSSVMVVTDAYAVNPLLDVLCRFWEELFAILFE